MSLTTKLIGWAMKLPPATHSDLVCEVDLRVPMPDGTVLLANRTAPRGENDLPIVLIRTPYTLRGTKPDLTSILLAERGYQVIVQNCRGTFGSDGEFWPFRDDRDDGLGHPGMDRRAALDFRRGRHERAQLPRLCPTRRRTRRPR
ncbi:MAG TPA: CocE/NonD family hydrolase [Mycobacterium sp.]|nr:CocE/NonD family hydrolase [Mycobacterium sp.]HUH71972.1 CocE/NonD family hydrolase [Mycobacterium sp.]